MKTGAAPKRFSYRRELCIALGLCLAVWSIYAQTAGFGFVDCDDGDYVYRNPHVQRGLTPGNIYWACSATEFGTWQPLTWLSLMAESQLHIGSPGARHLTNVVLHALNVLLLFLFLRLATGACWRSAGVAALLAVHPLHVESVAWISARKDVLSMFCMCTTLLAYRAYTRAPRLRTYLLTACSFALGLAAKPMLMTLPLLLALFDCWPLERTARASRRLLLREKAPLLVMAAGSLLVTWYAQEKSGALQPFAVIPLAGRLANAAVSFCWYPAKLLWPAGLNVLYLHPAFSGQTVPGWIVAGALLLAAALFAVRHLWNRHRFVSVGLLWYLLCLIPVCGLAQIGLHSRADRFAYMPSIGLYLVIIWSLALPARSRRLYRIAAVSIVAGALMLFGGVSRRQAAYWHDSVTLFQRAADCDPRNFVARGELAFAYAARGEHQQAVVHLRRALAMRPASARLHHALGKSLAALGKNAQALSHYRRAFSSGNTTAELLTDISLAKEHLGNN